MRDEGLGSGTAFVLLMNTKSLRYSECSVQWPRWWRALFDAFAELRLEQGIFLGGSLVPPFRGPQLRMAPVISDAPGTGQAALEASPALIVLTDKSEHFGHILLIPVFAGT